MGSSNLGAVVNGASGPRSGQAAALPSARRLACLWGLAALLALAGCEAPTERLSDDFLQRYAVKDPTPTNFYQCHGYGCAVISHIALSDAEWREVRVIFASPPTDAAAERRQIADALALIERQVGARTGTSAHQWSRHNGHIDGNPHIDPTQLDCIDEAVNSWTYLTMVARDGMLRFHTVEGLAYAGGLPDFNFALRNTAVIRVTASGVDFAVDPTLVDAGERPLIFPLSIWSGPWPLHIPPDGNNTPTTANRN